MKFVWSAVLALGVAGAAYADDDEGKTPARTYTQAEVEALVDLATRVHKLEELQQDAELEKLKAAAAKEKQEEGKGLPERISALEKKMGSAGQTWDASKMLTFSTPDGNFTAKVGGRIYFVYRDILDGKYSNAANGGAKDSFIVDTARIQLDGSFYKDFYYRVETEGKSGSNAGAHTLNEAYIGWRGLGDWVAIQAGLFKVPISQEETCSSRFIDFAERSVLNRITPGRDTQVMLYGSLFEKILEWNLGIMNGPLNRETTKLITDNNDEKDYYFRFFLTPFRNSDMALFKQLRVGMDASTGKKDDGILTAPAAVTSGDWGLTQILPGSLANVFIQGEQTRENFNFSWLYGSASLRAEYARVRYDLEGTGALNGAFIQKAYYVAATYILTGEEKPLENRIKPKNNFDPLTGGWGAWELALRWGVIDGGNGVGAGVYPTMQKSVPNSNHKTTEYTASVNWWMVPNVAIRFDWEHMIYGADQIWGNRGALKRSEDCFYIRWQIDF